jgi:integrase
MKESTETAKIELTRNALWITLNWGLSFGQVLNIRWANVDIERRLDHLSLSTTKGYFQANPSGSTQRPAPECLDEEKVTALLAVSSESMETQDLHDVVNILLNTGLRVGELCELRFADVDHNNRQLAITATKSCIRRVVPVGPETLQILETRHEQQPNSEFVLGKCPRGVVERVERQLRTLKGMSRVKLHMLRRTFSMRLVNAGAPVAVVMAIGGWKAPILQNEQK